MGAGEDGEGTCCTCNLIPPCIGISLFEGTVSNIGHCFLMGNVAADQAEKERLFGQLTDAAGELMNLGFEDIYQDSKAKIADTLGE